MPHCSYEEETYIIALEGTERYAYWGATIEIVAEDFEINKTKLLEYKEWLRYYKITEEPGWYLCALYSH